MLQDGFNGLNEAIGGVETSPSASMSEDELAAALVLTPTDSPAEATTNNTKILSTATIIERFQMSDDSLMAMGGMDSVR